MGLKDRYAQMTGAAPASPAAAPASAAPSTPPPSTPTSAAPSAASSSSPAAASPATGSPDPAVRDLAAVRARLAQRQSPGVNPPESKVPETAFDRTTAEAPDGSLVLLPNHQDVLKAAAKVASSSAPLTPAATGGELTRGQKAAATRAANKAAKASEPSTPAPVAVEPPSAPAEVDEEFEAEVKFAEAVTLAGFTLEQLLGEVLRRFK